jgi:hypothetical protein
MPAVRHRPRTFDVFLANIWIEGAWGETAVGEIAGETLARKYGEQRYRCEALCRIVQVKHPPSPAILSLP